MQHQNRRISRSEHHTPSDSVLALRRYLQSPKGQADMARQALEWKQKQEAKLAFFESPEFNQLMEELLVDPRSVSEDDINRVEQALAETFKKCPNHKVFSVEVPFENFGGSGWLYQNTIFEIVCGQGCFVSVYSAEGIDYKIDGDTMEESLFGLDHLS